MSQWRWLFGSLFYDAFSVTRLNSVDDRVTSQWWIDEDIIHALNGIQAHGLSVQAIKAYVSTYGHWDLPNDGHDDKVN
jgi:hypothetical protein